MKTFETTSIQLTAAILTELNCDFEIDPNKVIDNKAIIRLSYPDGEESNLKRIVESFERKELKVNLYRYNRKLNIVRDTIFSRRARNAKRNG